MPDLVTIKYKQTGKSKKINALGMREMQEERLPYSILIIPPNDWTIKISLPSNYSIPGFFDYLYKSIAFNRNSFFVKTLIDLGI